MNMLSSEFSILFRTASNDNTTDDTNNKNQNPANPAVSTMDKDDEFPPCTADQCHVDEQEKKAAKSRTRPSCEMTEKCVNACAAYGRVCPCAARIASHAACDAMQELQKDSHIFQAGPPDFTYLNAEDLQIGPKLGEGGFSNVNQCLVVAKDHPDYDKELAVKYLKRRAMVDLHHFKHGAADLAVEAYFLQTLNHPNIVQLHGITAGSVETNVATGQECGFFIVVDRLYDTLEKRLEVWRQREQEQSASGGPAKALLGLRRSAEFKEAKRLEILERCRIALSIAKGMNYLHSLNIVFRDLKPDNIGFDKDGVLKLFDFGLAKELKHPKEDGSYRLTGHTGSRRYMAPEVALDKCYNLSVDVYSFGILLWELIGAEKPFYGYSSNKHMQLVVLGGERPKMDSGRTQYWPPALQNLMKRCWSKDPLQRPTFEQIIHVLETKILQSNCNSNNNKPAMESQTSLGLEECSSEDNSMIGDDLSGHRKFGRLFQSKRADRSRSGGGGASAPLTSSTPNWKQVDPASKPQGRARSWGFGVRR